MFVCSCFLSLFVLASCVQMQVTYYRQVIDLYTKVNGASESCKTNARACSNRTSTPDADTADISPPFPQPTYTPAFDERIHIALKSLGLTDNQWTTVKLIECTLHESQIENLSHLFFCR